MDAIDVLRTKRDGGRLTRRADPLGDRRLHRGAPSPDEQMSALLMAVFFRGMDAARARRLDRRR